MRGPAKTDCLSLHITLCISFLWHDRRIKLHARTHSRGFIRGIGMGMGLGGFQGRGDWQLLTRQHKLGAMKCKCAANEMLTQAGHAPSTAPFLV